MPPFLDAGRLLSGLGLPGGDDYQLTPSTATFPDGADFRIEVPVINSFATFQGLLRRAREHGVVVNRVTETLGLFRHTRAEILDYVNLAAAEGIELVFSVGPRATYDTSASRLSDQGSFMGYRLRGMDQLRRAVDDVLRGIELGCRAFVVYDEGLLDLLASARGKGAVPADVRFKASAHLGYANPLSVALLERLGADSVNPVRDLPLPAMAAIRQRVRVPLDLHTDNPPASGGFVRTYEAPAIVQVAKPVHLKSGNSVLDRHGQRTDAADGARMADQVAIVVEMMRRFAGEFLQSAPAPVTLDGTAAGEQALAGLEVKGVGRP